MKNIDPLVIFDLDGVLVDSQHLILDVWNAFLTAHNIHQTREFITDKFTGLSAKDGMFFIESTFNIPFSPQEIKLLDNINNETQQRLKPIPGVAEVMKNFQYKKCIASGSRLNSLKKKLEVAGLKQYFPDDVIFSSEMVENGKPAPDLFLHAAKKMEFPIEGSIVVEDGIPGIQSAKMAHAGGVFAFIGGEHLNDKYIVKVKSEKPDIIFDDMKLLPNLIDEYSKNKRLNKIITNDKQNY